MTHKFRGNKYEQEKIWRRQPENAKEMDGRKSDRETQLD